MHLTTQTETDLSWSQPIAQRRWCVMADSLTTAVRRAANPNAKPRQLRLCFALALFWGLCGAAWPVLAATLVDWTHYTIPFGSPPSDGAGAIASFPARAMSMINYFACGQENEFLSLRARSFGRKRWHRRDLHKRRRSLSRDGETQLAEARRNGMRRNIQRRRRKGTQPRLRQRLFQQRSISGTRNLFKHDATDVRDALHGRSLLNGKTGNSFDVEPPKDPSSNPFATVTTHLTAGCLKAQIEFVLSQVSQGDFQPGSSDIPCQPKANGDIAILVDFSIFKGNRSGNLGGAVDIEKSADLSKTIVRLRRASFSRNTADGSGGAISASDAQLLASQTVFADNSAKQQGGAVALNNAQPLHSVLANSLFVRNSAPNGGAFSGDDSDFINSTVDSNAGVAIANAASHPPVHIKLANTIVSNNSQGGCGPAGLFDDGRRNLQFPSADCGASIDVANPHLDSMYIPLPKSPPSGAGDMTVCMHQPVDGRDIYGSARGSSGTCAIGAAENLLLRQASGGNSGGCNCGRTLVDRLRRALPFGQ